MKLCRSKSSPVVLGGDKRPDDEEDGMIVVAIARDGETGEHEEAKRGEACLVEERGEGEAEVGVELLEKAVQMVGSGATIEYLP